MTFKTDQVSLEAIDTKNKAFQITTRLDIEDIQPSIRSVGIINDPVLVEDGQKFIICSGFRRIRAAAENQMDCIRVKICSASKSTLAAAQIAITDNALQRELNVIEQVRAIQLLFPFFESTKDLANFARTMNLPGNASLVDKLKRISRLDPAIHQFILTGNLSMATALLIETLPDAERLPVARFIQSLRISLSIQREMFIHLTEIAARESIGILSLLSDNRISNIMEDSRSETKEKARQVRKLLRYRRYPAISQAEADFSNNVRMLNIDPSIRFVPPEGFEGLKYSLQFSFTDIQSFQQAITRLNTLAENPVMQKILD